MSRRYARHTLVISAVLALGPPVLANTYSSPPGVIRAGVNYFSLPALPGDSDPQSLDPALIFAGIPIEGKLAYWCRLSQSWHVYPSEMSLVYWHMAHRLEADRDYTVSFQGTLPTVEVSTCMNPSQPGLAFISQPYDSAVYWADFEFSSEENPGERLSAAQAAANGWVEDYLIEGAPDSGIHITLDGAGHTSPLVKPWRGYWVTVKVGPAQHKLMIYWPTEPAPLAAADFDRDGDVDGDDLAHFQACSTGACLGPPGPGCENADLDNDGDVDQSDFGIFQVCISGPDIEVESGCGP